MNRNIKDLVIQGGFWNTANKLLYLFLGFIQLLILARLLSPKDFGLMSIALLTMATFDSIISIGFTEALIQKKGEVSHYFDTVWSVLALRGFFISFIIFSFAGHIAIFFKDPSLIPIIKVISLSAIFQGIGSIGIIIFRKEINFYKYFIYQGCGSVVNFVISIALALILRNVWALIIGYVMGDFARFVISYYLYRYVPKIRISFVQFKEFFAFGIWIFLSSFTSFLISNIDRLIISKILGIVPLGFYQVALSTSKSNFSQIIDTVYEVTFPFYSKIKDDIKFSKEFYTELFRYLFLIIFPCMSFVFIFSSEIIKIFLGEKWLQVIPLVRVFSLLGFILVLNAPLSSMILAKNKQKNGLIFNVLQLIILLSIITPLTINFGINGAAVAVFLSITLGCIFSHAYFYKIFGLSFIDILSKLKRVIFCCLFFVFALIIIKSIFRINEVFTFLVIFFVSSLFYILLTKILKLNIFLILEELKIMLTKQSAK